MTDKLKNIIQEEIVKLPKEVQEAINALDWASAAAAIGKKYLLDENDINNFQVETMLVLFGIENANLYAINIENEVGTTKDDAEKMAAEAYEKIFMPISDVFVENIKKSGKDKDAKPEQNLNFILSGGDYSAFMEQRKTEEEPEKRTVPTKPRITDIKNKFTI